MFVYFIAVFSVVIILSAALLIIFNKIKLMNFRTVLAISLSSVLSGLLFPGLFNLISNGRQSATDIPVLLFVLLSTIVLYIILTFILGIVISLVIPEGALKAAGNAGGGGQAVREREQDAPVVENASAGAEDNYLAEIYSSHITEKTIEDANEEDIALEAENNLEKSVDSAENIDKMGLETISEEISGAEDLKTAENLSVDDCVDEAFRLKELGDPEGAILYYMYALDRKPAKELVFWIVLDMCVLYKSLGQIGFAREILSSYVDSYSDVMDNSIRDEIERNLIYIQN